MPDIKTSITISEGETVIVRTVTMHYTGRVVAVDDRWLALTDAAWIADSGRWHKALADGTLNEVEPYPDGDTVLVALGAVVEVAPWRHPLPRTAK